MTPLELAQIADAIADKVADRLSERAKLVDRYALANILGVSVPTIDRYRKKGLIPNIHIGGRVLFDPATVIAALQSNDEPHEESHMYAAGGRDDAPLTLVQSTNRD